jgi:hypothetical protein
MCDEVGTFRPRHQADCIHNKSLQLSAWMQPVEGERNPPKLCIAV